MPQIIDYAIEKWGKIAAEAVKEKGYFTVALSGGKTPVQLYRKLSEKKTLPWDKTHVFMVDERFVPYDSDENNYHMINRVLLRQVDIPAKNIHPIITSEISSQASAENYERDIRSYCRSTGIPSLHFDLIFLGIGEDGHTASLFPGEQDLRTSNRLALAVIPSDSAKKERVTLTLSLINHSRNIIFVATGDKKAKVVKEIVEEEKSLLPAAMVKPRAGKLLFLLDKEAGSLLSERT